MKCADIAILIAMIIWASDFALTTAHAVPGERPASSPDWALIQLLHVPLIAILSLLVFGFVERFDYFWVALHPPRPGNLPANPPKLCVQLLMFNEDAVAERVIAAACALEWPRHALEVQVLDDSTDAATAQGVRDFCMAISVKTEVNCRYIQRTDRKGYKAGALEEGRKLTDAQYTAIFDADFVPPPDFLTRAIPHFYDITGRSLDDLAVVQAQPRRRLPSCRWPGADWPAPCLRRVRSVCRTGRWDRCQPHRSQRRLRATYADYSDGNRQAWWQAEFEQRVALALRQRVGMRYIGTDCP